MGCSECTGDRKSVEAKAIPYSQSTSLGHSKAAGESLVEVVGESDGLGNVMYECVENTDVWAVSGDCCDGCTISGEHGPLDVEERRRGYVDEFVEEVLWSGRCDGSSDGECIERRHSSKKCFRLP